MHVLALTAQQIGYWGDKAITIAVVLAVLVFFTFKGTARRRGEDAARAEELEADRAADIYRAGPPRFNG